MLRCVTSRAAVSCAVEVGLELAATTSRNQDTGLDRSAGMPGEVIIVQNTEYYAVALLFGRTQAQHAERGAQIAAALARRVVLAQQGTGRAGSMGNTGQRISNRTGCRTAERRTAETMSRTRVGLDHELGQETGASFGRDLAILAVLCLPSSVMGDRARHECRRPRSRKVSKVSWALLFLARAQDPSELTLLEMSPPNQHERLPRSVTHDRQCMTSVACPCA